MAKPRPVATIAHNPHELGIIARADRFSALVWLGRLNKERIECASEADVRAAAQRLADTHRKPAMIYAIAGETSALLCTVQPTPNGRGGPGRS